MGKPKGGSTVQTTQKAETTYPQWTQDALQNLVTAGGAMNAPFIQTPSYAVAGMNPDQLKAFELARQGAQAAYSTGPVKVEGNPYASAAKVGAASQVNPNAIAEGLNPYLGAVLKPALAQAERSRNENQAAIGARAAASGSFGGSREAIERGQADRAYQEGTASMVANLMSQGWDQASALAQTNAQMQQQATLAQAGYDQQAGMYNAGVPLELARLQSGLTDANQARQQSALQALLGIGNQQQAFGQSVLDTPYTALARYAALVPQQLNSTQNTVGTQPNTAQSPLQSILGAGVTLGSAWMKSDRNSKTNIERMGKDPDTGLQLYAYDYQSDVDAAKKSGKPMPPKRVGPMAQEARKEGMPTKKIGGTLAMLMGEG